MKENNIAKGLAMLYVLFIHLALPNGANVGQIVLPHQCFSLNNACGFITPLFFILLGFTYTKIKKPVGIEIKKKVLHTFLYFVKCFVVTGVLFAIIEVVKEKYTVTECLRALLCEFLTRATCQIFGSDFYFKTTFHDVFVTTWYVWAYIFAILFFIFLVRIPSKTWKTELCVLAGSGLVGLFIYVFLPELPFELNVVPSMVFLMYAAQLIKSHKLYHKFTELRCLYKVPALIAAFLLGEYCLSFGSVGWLSHGTFSNPYGVEGMESLPDWAVWFLCMFGCLLMTYWLIYMCRLIMKIPKVGDFLAYFGVNSFDTMMLHAFFIMSICEITGLVCGRYLNAKDTISLGAQLQCGLMFALAVVMCYFWPKFKMMVIRKVMLKNE